MRKKKAKAGFRGYPLGTVAFYGHDDRCATKVAVGIFSKADSEPAALRRWFSERHDIRDDEEILTQVVTFLHEHDVHSVSMVDCIIGCPHEDRSRSRFGRMLVASSSPSAKPPGFQALLTRSPTLREGDIPIFTQ